MKKLTVQLIAAAPKSSSEDYLTALEINPKEFARAIKDLDKAIKQDRESEELDFLSNEDVWEDFVLMVNSSLVEPTSEWALAVFNYITGSDKKNSNISKILKTFNVKEKQLQRELKDIDKIKVKLSKFMEKNKVTTTYLEKVWLPSMGFKLKWNARSHAYILSKPFTKRISSHLLKLGFKPQKGKNPFWNPTGDPKDEGYYFRDSKGVDFAFIENEKGQWLFHVV